MDAKNLTNKAEQLSDRDRDSSWKTLDDLNGLLKLMMKSALERMLDTELDVHLAALGRLPGSAVESLGRSRGELRCQGVAHQERRAESSERTFPKNRARGSWRIQDRDAARP